jgi:hypothetical protein
MGFSPGFSSPALKRMIKVELLCATLKLCFPLLTQGSHQHSLKTCLTIRNATARNRFHKGKIAILPLCGTVWIVIA